MLSARQTQHEICFATERPTRIKNHVRWRLDCLALRFIFAVWCPWWETFIYPT